MEPIRVAFYFAVGLMILAFLFLVFNTLIGNLNPVVLETREVSKECLKDCSQCKNQAECVTADCAWVEDKDPSKSGCVK